MARNLALTGRAGFEPGQAAGGSTSLLWTLLLAPAHLFGWSPVFYTRALGLGLWLQTLFGLHQVLRRDGWSAGESWTAVAAAATCGNALWLVWSGMEAVLVVCLSICTVAAWRARRTGLTSVLLFLLPLARPEGAALGAALALFERRWRRRLTLVLPPVLATAASMAFWWTTAGTLLPTTFKGRRWLYGMENGIVWSYDVPGFVVQWLRHVWRYTAAEWMPIVVLLGWGVGLALARAWRRREHGTLALCLWAAGLAAIYACILPRIGHGGRYQPLGLVLIFPLAALGWFEAGRITRARWVGWFGASLVLAASVNSLALWRPVLLAGVDHINSTHRAMAAWVRASLPPEEKIAAFDIGALAWELPGRIVDMSALSRPSDAELLRERRMAERVREGRAAYVMLPTGIPDAPPPEGYLGTAGGTLDLQPVHQVTGDQRAWALCFRATDLAWPGQVLYRVAWRGEGR